MAPTINRVQRGESYAGYCDLTVMCCPVCGILYAIPERLRAEAQRKAHHAIEWCCPNGHELGYSGESDEEKLRRELDAQRDYAARLAAQRDQAQAEAKSHKGRATRFKNDRDRERKRVAGGVCPCCNRSFKNLSRHMAGQHPDFPPAESE